MNLTIFGLPKIVELQRFSVPFSRRNSFDSLGRYLSLHLSSLDIVEDINPPYMLCLFLQCWYAPQFLQIHNAYLLLYTSLTQIERPLPYTLISWPSKAGGASATRMLSTGLILSKWLSWRLKKRLCEPSRVFGSGWTTASWRSSIWQLIILIICDQWGSFL